MTSVKEQPSYDCLGSQRQQRAAQGLAFLNERRRIALDEIDKATFSRFHVKVCLVAGVGFFTDAYDIFTIIIAATMLGVVYGHDKDSTTGLNTFSTWQTASLKLATPLGNLVGQLLFGWLADMVGRRRMYGVELAIMIVATFGQAVSGHGPSLSILDILIFWRFIMGIGVGGDYPLSAVITSEFASTRSRGRLMTAVFSFQGLGQLAACLVALVSVVAFKDTIEHSTDNVDFTWRLLIGIGCIPAAIALYFRLTIPETPRFTADVDRRIGRAVRDIANTLNNGRYTVYADEDSVYESRVVSPRASFGDFIAYFSEWKHLRVLVGTAYSWFALDVAFYILTLDNVAFLTPLGFGLVPDPYQSLRNLCVGNIIFVLGGYIPGFVAAFLLIDVWGRKRLQLMGFVVLTILFWIMGFGYSKFSGHRGFVALYCIANFFQNIGPNTTTFVVPGEAFPTRYRTTAYGISAACGKLGAVIAQLLFAFFASKVDVLLEVLAFVMMTGVLSTLLIPETKQRTLEDLSSENQETYITGQGADTEMTVTSASSSCQA